MLTYTLSAAPGTPLYIALYRSIRADLLAGKLAPDERLPSKRSLAQHMKVSVITVENAYAQLLAEGYIYAVPRRGYFASPVERAPEPPACGAEPIAAPPEPPCFVDFRSNHPDCARFPFSVWSRILRDELSHRETKLLAATPANGVPELREAIAAYLFQFRGMHVSAEQIVVGAGSEYLYNLIVQLLGRAHVYAVENPGHVKIPRIYEKNGLAVRYVDVDERGMPVAGLRASGADVAHISPSHHFPTGVVMPIGRRQELLAWAGEAEGRYIIEDDYDSEFRFTLRPIPTLQSIDRAGRVIYVNTFSRTLAPSLRISYMVLPKSLTERYRAQLGFYSSTVPAMEQYTLARFLDEEYFEAHINRMRKSYRAQRDAVIDTILQSPLGEHCRVSGEDAGLHFLLTIDTKCTDHVLRADAEGRGVRLSFLSDFALRPGSAPQHTLVIHYPGIDLGRLRSALSILEALLYFRDWKYKGRK